MSLLGTLIQKSAQIGAVAAKNPLSPTSQQHFQLYELLRKARHTAFGRYYGFGEVLFSADLEHSFRRLVPATDYNSLYARWWSKAHLCDSPNVCWPGTVPYYALSSGTSQAATKHIPVTEDMLKAMKRGSRQLFFDITKFGLPSGQFTKQMLMVGSCTQPRQEGRHLTGDLSGIIGQNRPLWLERSYRPSRHITDLPDWDQRIERIAEEAPGWDIGFAVSNPMWMQIVLQRILERQGLRHIHELWPNFSLLVHGGVFFEPYRPTFEQMLGRPVQYLDSYMASEGFFAYQNRPDTRAMRLLTDAGIYFEFVPFNDNNFDENGDLRSPQPETLGLDEVREGENYALLLSTCAGAWRYLLGDTVQFTDAERTEIRLTGRTKQYLSVCGEHLSIDNLNEAIRLADTALRAGVREFAVTAQREGAYWAHEWFISCENPAVRATDLAHALDAALCELNEDYAIERRYALREVRVRLLPNSTFLNWLAKQGKLNGQAKVPKVLKGAQWIDFQTHLSQIRNCPS